jgi:hypothetical protein
MEGSSRGLTHGFIPAFTWEDREKPQKASVGIAGHRTEV